MISSNSSKVIINKKNKIKKMFCLENEVGLSTYDLALISVDKSIKKTSFSLSKLQK